MRLSLALMFLAVCLVHAKSSPSTETKSLVICEECEFSKVPLSENDIAKIKMQKLQICLAHKQKQIDREETDKSSRVARSASQDEDSSFTELFKTSGTFKRVLGQYLKLKATVVAKTDELKKEIGGALDTFEQTADDELSKPTSSPAKKASMLKKLTKLSGGACEHKLTCDAPKTVIRVKQAVLTSRANEQKCGAVNVLQFDAENMDDACYNKDEATKRLSTICDGETDCSVSIAMFFNTMCDCTAKKHLEVDYVCEPETPEAAQKHSVAKRSLYYQNSQREIDQDRRFTATFLDYYDGLYGYGYGGDYYGYGYGYDYYGGNAYGGGYGYDYYGCGGDYYDYYSYYYGGCDYYGYAYPLAAKAKATGKQSAAVAAAQEAKKANVEGIKKLAMSYGVKPAPTAFVNPLAAAASANAPTLLKKRGNGGERIRNPTGPGQADKKKRRHRKKQNNPQPGAQQRPIRRRGPSQGGI